jgi:hypothetical protein
MCGEIFFSKSRGLSKLGRQPSLATGDFTTMTARVRGRWRLHRPSSRVLDNHRLRNPAIISCFWRGERKKKKRRKEGKEEKKGRKRREERKEKKREREERREDREGKKRDRRL